MIATPIAGRVHDTLWTTPAAAQRAGVEASDIHRLVASGVVDPTTRSPGKRQPAWWSDRDITRIKILLAARSRLPLAWGAGPLRALWEATATTHASITLHHDGSTWRWYPTGEVLPAVGIVVDMEGLRLDHDR